MYIHYSPNQIAIRWTIYRGFSKLPEDFTRAKVVCTLISSENRFAVNVDVVREVCGQQLLITVPANLPEGVYAIEAIWTKNGFRSVARSRRDAVLAVTANEEESTDHGAATTATILNIRSSAATFGYDGLSAYELALLKGLTTKDETTWVEEQIETAVERIETSREAAVSAVVSEKSTSVAEILAATNRGLNSVDASIAEAEAAIGSAKVSAIAEAVNTIGSAKDAAVDEATGAVDMVRQAAVGSVETARQDALDAIGEAIQHIDLTYDILPK